MNEEIKLIAGKENEIDFELDIKGAINPHMAICRFFIVTESVTYVLPCVKKDGSRFCVKIPVLPLSNDKHICGMEVIAEGYYFKPYEGHITFDVIPSVEVKDVPVITEPISTPELPVVKTDDKVTENKEAFQSKLRKNLGMDKKVTNVLAEVEKLNKNKKLLKEQEEHQLELKRKKAEEIKHNQEQKKKLAQKEKEQKIREAFELMKK
jgi:hypothetical protein